MKRLVISLLLLIAMLSSLLPLTLSAFAEDNETPITGGGATTALTYEDFYVKDASLLLWLDAFDPAEGNVSLTDGTWRNLVAGGADATLLSVLPSGDPTNGTQVYTQKSTKTLWEQYQVDPSSLTGVRTFIAGRITYAEDGVTPLYASVTTFYLDDGEGKVAANTSVTIDGVAMRLFATVNTTYAWVEEAGVTTYVTESEWGESQNQGATYYIFTDGSRGTKRVKHSFTTEDPGEGNYTSKIEGGRFVEANIYDRIAGWKMGERGGVQSVIADFMSSNGEINVAIDLPKQYIPAIDAEYTLEIVGGAAAVEDTDGTVNTLAQNVNYQGEGGRVTAIAIGNMGQYWCRASTIKTGGSAMFDMNYYVWPDQEHRSNTAITITGDSTNIPAWHLVYTRTRAEGGTGFDVTQELSYYNGSRAVSTSATPYKGFVPTEAGERLHVMNNVSNTTYAVRLYNRPLTAEEKRSNHFGDLVRYYGLDLTAYATLSAEKREIVLENMLSLPVGLDKAEGTAVYNEIIGELTYVPEMDVYDRLYVQDGLTVLLTAFDENEASLSLTSGSWYNKIANRDGEFEQAAVIGKGGSLPYVNGAGEEKTLTVGWQKRAGGGIGYDMTLAYSKKNDKSHYVELPFPVFPRETTPCRSFCRSTTRSWTAPRCRTARAGTRNGATF